MSKDTEVIFLLNGAMTGAEVLRANDPNNCQDISMTHFLKSKNILNGTTSLKTTPSIYA